MVQHNSPNGGAVTMAGAPWLEEPVARRGAAFSREDFMTHHVGDGPPSKPGGPGDWHSTHFVDHQPFMYRIRDASTPVKSAMTETMIPISARMP